MESKTKRCSNSECLKDLPIESFSKNRATKDGLEPWCKDCKKKKQQDYRDRKAGDRKAGVRSQESEVRSRKAPASRARDRGRKQRNSKPLPTNTRATPEQIIADLRRDVAIEIIDMIQEKFGL